MSPGQAIARDTPSIVILGGGNGVSAVLQGLSARVRRGETIGITAVLATADNGGSSGRLRRERGGLPPGDVRNCLLALARDRNEPIYRVFAHRYDGQGGLAGHALGNLVLAALNEQEGCFLQAVSVAGEMLGACGRVLPVSPRSVHLEGVAVDGCHIAGESEIGAAHCAMERVWLEPSDPEPSPGVIEAIRQADLVVVGPGSLFTSLLPVLMVPGVAAAVRETRAKRVTVANLMTQPGETVGMSLIDHLEALDRHVGPGLVEEVLVNESPLDPRRLKPYLEQRATPVVPQSLTGRAEKLIGAEMVTTEGKIRHDPTRLSDALLNSIEFLREPVTASEEAR